MFLNAMFLMPKSAFAGKLAQIFARNFLKYHPREFFGYFGIYPRNYNTGMRIWLGQRTRTLFHFLLFVNWPATVPEPTTTTPRKYFEDTFHYYPNGISARNAKRRMLVTEYLNYSAWLVICSSSSSGVWGASPLPIYIFP